MTKDFECNDGLVDVFLIPQKVDKFDIGLYNKQSSEYKRRSLLHFELESVNDSVVDLIKWKLDIDCLLDIQKWSFRLTRLVLLSIEYKMQKTNC